MLLYSLLCITQIQLDLYNTRSLSTQIRCCCIQIILALCIFCNCFTRHYSVLQSVWFPTRGYITSHTVIKAESIPTNVYLCYRLILIYVLTRLAWIYISVVKPVTDVVIGFNGFTDLARL